MRRECRIEQYRRKSRLGRLACFTLLLSCFYTQAGACLSGHHVILLAHSYFLNHDAKQLARMTPYSPLSTLIAAARLRDDGHAVELFDATFADGLCAFEEMLDRTRPSLVAIMEDNFNFLTKMCTARRRRDALAMIEAAKNRGCRVLVNGPDPNDQPKPYLTAGADAVLTGDGEETLMEIAAIWRADRAVTLDA